MGRGGVLLRLLAALPPRRARRRSSTAEVWELPDQTRTPNHPLKPRHLRLHALFADGEGADPVNGRRLVLGNNDVRIGYVVTGTDPSPLYRNAIGDECVYVESGTGTVETVFGVAALPRRRLRDGPARDRPPLGARRAEPALRRSRPTATSRPPKRYLSKYGQLLEHAPYCERDLHGPAALRPGRGQAGAEDVEVLVKHRATAASSAPG